MTYSDSRRLFISAVAGAGAIGSLSFSSKAFPQQGGDHAIESQNIIENQSGDPLGPIESITFDPYKIQKLLAGQKASFVPRKADFGASILQLADTFVGKNRNNAQSDISAFLNAFGLPFSEPTGKPLPFCAAAVSYISTLAYLGLAGDKIASVSNSQIRSLMSDIDHHHFYPTPSVVDMYHVAAGKRRWVGRRDAGKARPGSLIIFDWKKNGGADHVGIVRKIDGSTIHTIEFNTSITVNGSKRDGGEIANKERKLDETVKGFVLTHIVTAI